MNKIYPANIKIRPEMDCRLGIKTSLPDLPQLIALTYMLYIINGRKSCIQYSEEYEDNDFTKIKLKKEFKTLWEENFPQFETDKISNLSLFTSQLEALQMGLGLIFKLGKISFVEVGGNTAERTGGNRFNKVISFSTNIKILDLFLNAYSKEDVNKELVLWLNNKPSNYCISIGLKSLLTIFSEDTQMKIRTDGNEEIFFQQNGIYENISQAQDVINKDSKEQVGPLRVINSFIRDGLHPYLEIKDNAFHLKENTDFEEYKKMVETSFQLSPQKVVIYNEVERNNANYNKNLNMNQKIYFGAPGTGKSHEIKELIKDAKHIRTTFHPDSDYSTFVGSYKPIMNKILSRIYTKEALISKLSEMKGQGISYPCHKFGALYYKSLKLLSVDDIKEILSRCGFNDSMDQEINKGIAIGEDQSSTNNVSKITYSFVPQAFTNAYTKAWNIYPNPVYLIIEEINRGNCAQIFGDLFQLLDRNEKGFSDYPIEVDNDLQRYLAEVFSDEKTALQLTEEDISAINEIYKEECSDIISKVSNGERLILPPNLYIYATMNTSDQSLFPMDSAFKRRWEWEYVPISFDNTEIAKAKIIIDKDHEYNWKDFVVAVNDKILSDLESSDKQLGPWFAKPKCGIIERDQFVSKVMFYLLTDAYKDMNLSDEKFYFEDLFKNDGNSKLVHFIETGLKINNIVQQKVTNQTKKENSNPEETN